TLPPRPSPAHEAPEIARAHPQVGHPTAGLDLGLAPLPVLDAIDPHGPVRGIARHIMDKPPAMAPPGRAVVALISGHAPGVRRRRHRLAHKGMLAFLAPADLMQSVVLQGLAGRRIGTPAVCGDDALVGRVVLAELDEQPFGGMAFTIIFARPSMLPDR